MDWSIGGPASRTHDPPHHCKIDVARLWHVPQPAFVSANLCDKCEHLRPGSDRRCPSSARSRNKPNHSTSLQSCFCIHCITVTCENSSGLESKIEKEEKANDQNAA